MYATRQNVTVSFEDIGEGIAGCYDETDPDDVALLRFYVTHNDQDVDDASYCTQVPVDTDPAVVAELASKILDKVFDDVIAGRSIKKACEKLSWITPEED